MARWVKQNTIFYLALAIALVLHLLVFAYLPVSVNFSAEQSSSPPVKLSLQLTAPEKPAEQEKTELKAVQKEAKQKSVQVNRQTAINKNQDKQLAEPSKKKPSNLPQQTSKTTGLAARSLTQAGQPSFSAYIRRITPASKLTSEEKSYLEAWQARVERIGRLNYPAEVAKQNLSGKLRLAVLINADGSLANVELIESSGKEVLDAAAIKILNLAAPFAPLPSQIQQTAKQLEIIRTWRIGQGLSAN